MSRDRSPGFHAMIGNPPWVVYFGKGRQPISETEADFLREAYGKAARQLATHNAFAVRAAELLNADAALPGRLGLILPTSMADAARYGEARAAHVALCKVERGLPSYGDAAFATVFQPCMALISTRRTGSSPPDVPGDAAWELARPGLDPLTRQLLDQLKLGPRLPKALFGDQGYRSCRAHVGAFVNAKAPTGPHTTPLYEGESVQEFSLLPPTAFADPEQLPILNSGKWRKVDVFIRNTARYPIASPGSRQSFRNSILAGTAVPPYTLGFLLAYLNSSPVRWFHFHEQRDAREGTPQVKVGHLRALPAPAAAAVPALARFGDDLAAQPHPVSVAQRAALDDLVADALALSQDARQHIAAWSARNPPPLARGAPRKTDATRAPGEAA